MHIKNLRNTRSLSLISVLALMAFMTIAILPAVNAIYIDTSPRKTTAYITVAPIVIGKGQQLTVNCWVWPAPSGPSYYAQTLNVIYYENYTVTFTRPDGSKDTFMPENPSITEKEGSPKPGKTEAVGTTYFFYEPNQVGTWSVSFSYPGKTFYMLNSANASIGVFYEAATSQTVQFTVQEDPVNAGLINGWPWAPLPTGYWQETINANNREWSELGGDWIGSNINMNFNPYGTGT